MVLLDQEGSLRTDELEAQQYAAIKKDYQLATSVFKAYKVAYFCNYCTKKKKNDCGSEEDRFAMAWSLIYTVLMATIP